MSKTNEWTPLRTWLTAQWTSTPIHWNQNFRFDPDDSTDTSPHDAGGPWIRPTIRARGGGDYRLWTVGDTKVATRERELIIDLFAPVNTGTSVIGGYAETLRDMFWELSLGVMEFEVPSIHVMPDEEFVGDGEKRSRWYRQQVRVNYEYEDWKGQSNVNVSHEREVTQTGFFATAAAGTLVYMNGSTITKAIATAEGTLATHMVSRVFSDDRGSIVAPGCNVAWTGHGGSAGDALYTSAATAGGVATTAPSAPNYVQQIGGVNSDGTTWFFLLPARLGS